MQRRDSIKRIAFFIGGSLWVPGWSAAGRELEPGYMPNDVQRQILGDWVDWLIPETDVPGAKKLGVDLFVWKIIEDCHDPGVAKMLSDDLDCLSRLAKDKIGRDWVRCSKAQKDTVFFAHASDGSKSGSFAVVKQRAIQGYLSSEYIMTQVFVYEMAPGRYDGYFPVSSK